MSSATPAVRTVRNRELDGDELATARLLAQQLVGSSRVVGVGDAYTVAFAARLDRTLQQQIDAIAARPTAYRPGYIYAFWDRRDPTNVIKIGRTRQPVRRRMVQWDRVLGNADSVALLFAYYTHDNEVAEELLQKALFGEWLPKRVNALTAQRAIEYYRIDDVTDAKLFVKLLTRFVNRLLERRGQARVRGGR